MVSRKSFITLENILKRQNPVSSQSLIKKEDISDYIEKIRNARRKFRESVLQNLLYPPTHKLSKPQTPFIQFTHDAQDELSLFEEKRCHSQSSLSRPFWIGLQLKLIHYGSVITIDAPSPVPSPIKRSNTIFNDFSSAMNLSKFPFDEYKISEEIPEEKMVPNISTTQLNVSTKRKIQSSKNLSEFITPQPKCIKIETDIEFKKRPRRRESVVAKKFPLIDIYKKKFKNRVSVPKSLSIKKPLSVKFLINTVVLPPILESRTIKKAKSQRKIVIAKPNLSPYKIPLSPPKIRKIVKVPWFSKTLDKRCNL